MAILNGPFEIFDIGDGELVEFSVERFEQGEMTIFSKREQLEKRVDGLRVHLDKGKPLAGMPYRDITSKTLIAQLLPLLQNPQTARRTFRIVKHGVAPVARFQLEMV